MAGHNEIYITTVKLNSEEAKNRLMELSKTVENLKKQRSKALQKGNMPLFDHLGKELKKAEREMRQFKSDTMNVADTLKEPRHSQYQADRESHAFCPGTDEADEQC